MKKLDSELDTLNSEFGDIENELAELVDEFVLQTEIEKIKTVFDQKLADFDKTIAELNSTRDARYKTLKTQTEAIHVEKMAEIERAIAQCDTNTENLKEQKRLEMEIVNNQLKTEILGLNNQRLNPDERKTKEEEIQRVHTEKVKDIDRKYNDLLIIERMIVDKLKSTEKDRWDASMKELSEIENEPASFGKQRQKIIDEKEFSIQDLLSDANEPTPINLSYWGFLVRILRNIDHYTARLREILPTSTLIGTNRFRSRILTEPEAFIVCDFVSISCADREEAGNYISDVLVPPLGNREFTITIKKSKKETEQQTDSILNSSSESATNSLTDTIETRNGLKTIKSTEEDKLNRRTENFEVGASASIPIQAVPVNVNAGYNNSQENETRIKNNSSKEQFAEELKNCIVANTATVNQTRELKQEMVKIIETFEESESTERITFSNPNPSQSIALKFYQANQVFKVGCGIDKISLIFTNGFTQFSTEIPLIYRILELIDENAPFSVDGLKYYIYRFCEVIDVYRSKFNFVIGI